MDLAWLAALAVLLLVTGLSALGYDTVRRRHAGRPFTFPDEPTRRLEDDTGQIPPPLPQESGPHPTAPGTAPHPSGPLIRKPVLPRLIRPALPLPRLWSGTGQVRFSAFGWPALAVLSLLLAGAGFAVFLLRDDGSSVPPGTPIVGIARFVGAAAGSEPSEALADDIVAAAGASGPPMLVRTTAARPANPEQAETERRRLKAGLLLWGEVGAAGGLTAGIALAPDFAIGHPAWERWTDLDPGMMVFPQHFVVRVPASAGTYPLTPLVIALAHASAGNLQDARKAAYGAQTTLESNGGSGQAGRFVQAALLAASGDYAQAAALFDQVDAAGMLTIEGRLDRALARMRSGDYAGSASDLETVLADREVANRIMARALLLRARTTASLPDLEESLRLDPQLAEARLEKGEALYRLSRPGEAKTELETLLKFSPDAAPAHRALGLVWLMLGNQEEAQKALARALGTYDGWIAGLRSEEAHAHATGDQDAARAATSGIVRLNRELAGVYLYKGMALADQARKQPKESMLGKLWLRIRGQPTKHEQAIASLQEAARLEPRRAEIFLQMAGVYSDSGDPGKAAEVLQQARDLDPSSPAPYLALARLQESQGNPGEAASTLNELIERSPRSYEAYELLHGIYTRAQDAASASAALERAYAVPPQTSQDRLWRGKFLLELGRSAEAIGEWEGAAADASLWEAQLLLGRIYEQRGDGPAALARYEAVLARQPVDPEALLHAGRLLMLAGRASEAEDRLARLTANFPDNVEGHLALAQLLLAKGQTDKAIAEAGRAVEAEGTAIAAHYLLGEAYEMKGDRKAAAEHFAAAAERDPNHFDALLRLAGVLLRDDRYSESIDAAQRAAALRAEEARPYLVKAEALLDMRDPDAALTALGEALRLSPQSDQALALTARAYTLKGDTGSAVVYADKAVAAAPRSAAGYVALGEVHLAAGRYERARETFSQLRTLDPTSAEALVGEGRSMSALGDIDKALALYAEAAKLDNRFAAAHLYAGHAYVELGRWDEAFRDYARAAELRPNWPEALYYLGRAYLQRKDLANAQKAFDRAVKGSPALLEAWFGLGVAQRDRGLRNEAIGSFTRATELNPAYSEAWLYLGLTYEEAGDYPRAAGAFQQALATATRDDIKQQAEQGIERVR